MQVDPYNSVINCEGISYMFYLGSIRLIPKYNQFKEHLLPIILIYNVILDSLCSLQVPKWYGWTSISQINNFLMQPIKVVIKALLSLSKLIWEWIQLFFVGEGHQEWLWKAKRTPFALAAFFLPFSLHQLPPSLCIHLYLNSSQWTINQFIIE